LLAHGVIVVVFLGTTKAQRTQRKEKKEKKKEKKKESNRFLGEGLRVSLK
jgi:hypothetical protein